MIAAGTSVPAVGSAPGDSRHAIELRITAEDPGRDFVPSSGRVTSFEAPGGPGVRVDSGVRAGSAVSVQFDSLLAKLIVVAADRTQALERARRALGELVIEGVPTSMLFLRAVVTHDAFTAAGGRFDVHTGWVESDPVLATQLQQAGGEVPTTAGATIEVPVGGRWLTVAVPGMASPSSKVLAAAREQASERRARSADASSDAVLAPMQSTVVGLEVAEGDHVEVGDPVAVVEAMKMQHLLLAPAAGRVTGLDVIVGASVAHGAVLCRIIA